MVLFTLKVSQVRYVYNLRPKKHIECISYLIKYLQSRLFECFETLHY